MGIAVAIEILDGYLTCCTSFCPIFCTVDNGNNLDAIVVAGLQSWNIGAIGVAVVAHQLVVNLGVISKLTTLDINVIGGCTVVLLPFCIE